MSKAKNVTVSISPTNYLILIFTSPLCTLSFYCFMLTGQVESIKVRKCNDKRVKTTGINKIRPKQIKCLSVKQSWLESLPGEETWDNAWAFNLKEEDGDSYRCTEIRLSLVVMLLSRSRHLRVDTPAGSHSVRMHNTTAWIQSDVSAVFYAIRAASGPSQWRRFWAPHLLS